MFRPGIGGYKLPIRMCSVCNKPIFVWFKDHLWNAVDGYSHWKCTIKCDNK